jgi:hypothetical protein
MYEYVDTGAAGHLLAQPAALAHGAPELAPGGVAVSKDGALLVTG